MKNCNKILLSLILGTVLVNSASAESVLGYPSKTPRFFSGEYKLNLSSAPKSFGRGMNPFQPKPSDLPAGKIRDMFVQQLKEEKEKVANYCPKDLPTSSLAKRKLGGIKIPRLNVKDPRGKQSTTGPVKVEIDGKEYNAFPSQDSGRGPGERVYYQTLMIDLDDSEGSEYGADDGKNCRLRDTLLLSRRVTFSSPQEIRNNRPGKTSGFILSRTASFDCGEISDPDSTEIAPCGTGFSVGTATRK